ncbi:DUF2334 domain-containing protein [Ramlibacter sp.]|uniref:DUF2334 domain-containing protein n=1 Tax=Ramlibacter sp. TaxID=1917967 RepID=UPI002606B8C7|nr:DUF2334 domain-containing protein [Ramlibacter sp.]MDB5956559.1 Papd-like protein [Ramlibacter sp.]
MMFFRRILLALVACFALAGAAGAQTLPVDRTQLQNLINQVRDPVQRAKLQALLAQLPARPDFATLQSLGLQALQILRTGITPTPAPAPAGAAPSVLVLYDAASGTEFDKLGFGYAIMLRNLLGHFNANVDLQPISAYTAGKVEAYNATFYLGAIYDNPVPAAFLQDTMTTAKPLVWFKYNLWQLAGNAAYNFTASKGIAFSALRGLNAAASAANPAPGFFDTVKYKGLDFVKYYAYDAARNVVNADPDIGVTTIQDATKAQQLVSIYDGAEAAGYVTRSGNFWYVADMPFSFIGPRDRYLVFADMLHDILGINHAESHQAMVRFEDVGALVSVQAMKTLSDYMFARHLPYSIATIPLYLDPLGAYNGGVAETVPLSQATNLKRSLDYAVNRGAEIVMHGYTHQYGRMKNPNTGVSGDDYEMWDIVDNKPVPEDSVDWVRGRLAAGLTDLRANGYNPVAWEMPHYQGSAIANRTAATMFNTTYQRVVYYTADKPNFFAPTGKDFALGQIFPYVIQKDYYGQRVLPENLGNIEYDIHTIDPTSNYSYTADDIVTNARYAKAVRDGFASFFFHPFWLEPEVGTPGFADFQKTMDGISQLGFTWVAPSKLP